MRKSIINTLLVCILLAFGPRAFAQFRNKPVIDNLLTGTQIAPNAEVAVWADYFNGTSLPASNNTSWHPAYKFFKSDGRAVLSINHNAGPIPLATFNCTVMINLTYYKWDPNVVPLPNNEVITVNSISLAVDYNKTTGATYKDKDFYMVQNAHYVKARVTWVSNAAVAKYLDLQVEVDQERYVPVANTTLTPLFTDASSNAINPVYNSATNEVTLNFSQHAVAGFAVEYDLEWTFIEDYNPAGNNVNTSSLTVTGNDFRFNSSRVTIVGTEYRLSSLYEMGHLAYRVRAVGKDVTNAPEREIRRVECDWSPIKVIRISPSPTLSGMLEHQKTFNWQTVTTYAEEGKKKDVITYYDGSLRPRQIVTQTIDRNGKKLAVVQDKIYDYQGRAAIEVMPVPVADTPIKYYPGRSRNTASTPVPYTKADFDVDQGASCNPPPNAMNDTAGASRYYSAKTDFKSATETNFNNYTPVANGFPFVQTVYTPDNTGRIAAQSAPGSMHKIGSGHETKYAYLKPDQVELDRLFGSEAGYAEHYQKQVVKDANGQASISYLNAKGQVVATCLAGKPENDALDVLSTYKSNAYNDTTALVVNLMNGNDRLIEENALVVSHTFYVAEAANYKFMYSVNAAKYDSIDCVPISYCVDCVYDLKISITNQCDVQYGPGGTGNILVDTTIGNFPNGSNYNTCVNDTPAYALSRQYTADANGYITVSLVPGTYTISKRLSINEAALDIYLRNYLNDRASSTIPGCKTLSDFQLEARSAIDLSDCGLTCVPCWQKLGFTGMPEDTSDYGTKREAYVTDQMNKLTAAGGTPNDADREAARMAFQSVLVECEELCSKLSMNRCEGYKELLLADIRPGGQYARYLLDTVNAVFSANDSSGIDRFNVLGQHQQSGFPDNLMSYQNIDPVDGYPEFDNSAYGVTLPGSSVATKVKDLTVDQFVKHFKEEWAEILLRNHPEYCHYKKCSLNQDVANYEQDMLNTETYAEAEVKGYLQPFDSESVTDDPFFNSTCGQEFLGSDYGDMWDRMINYRKSPRYYTYANVKDDIEILDTVIGGVVYLFNARNIYDWVGTIAGSGPAQDGDNVYATTDIYFTDRIGVFEITDLGNGRFLKRVKRVDAVDRNILLTYNFSMKQVAMMPLYCPEFKVGNTRRLFACLEKAEASFDSTCVDAKDRYWINFRAMYLANRGFLQHKVDKQSADPACACNPTVPAGKEKRIFPALSQEHSIEMYERDGQLWDPRELQLTGSEQEAELNEVNSDIASSCATQCALYAEFWREKLAGCNLNQQDMDSIIANMIRVCVNGCDERNPVGSSTVAPAKTDSVAYASFHEVLTGALGTSIYQPGICDELLIKMPKPYGHDYLGYLSPYADTCACDQKYVYAGSGGGQCTEGLQGLTPPDCPCAGSANISAKVKKELMIGRSENLEFVCNKCIGCLDLRPAIIAFQEHYPDLDSTNENYHWLLENFMNNELNMNVTHADYIQLAVTCMGLTAPQDNTKALLEDFLEFFEDIDGPLAVGALMKPVDLIRMDQGRVLMASSGANPAKANLAADFGRKKQSLAWSNTFDLAGYIRLVDRKDSAVASAYATMASTGAAVYIPEARQKAGAYQSMEVAGIMQTNNDALIPPGYGPKAAGVDECGCEKIMKLWQANPNASDAQLGKMFADKFNYGQPIPNFDKLKELCCKSLGGNEYSPNAPKPNPIEMNPNDDDNDDKEPVPPCKPPLPGQNIVYGENGGYWLKRNVQANPGLKFPGTALCDNSSHLSQMDICGCDKLITLDSTWQANGSQGTLAGFVKDEMNLDHLVPDINKLVSLCKLMKGEGAWNMDKVANLYQQTSNPILKLPIAFRCDPPPPPSNPCTVCTPDTPRWSRPTPCRRTAEFSCSQLEAMMRSVFGNLYTSQYTRLSINTFVSVNQAQWNDELIPAFKDSLGFGQDSSECEVSIAFTQDADDCGFPRKKYSSFFIHDNASDASITEVLKMMAIHGCGCEPPPSWLQIDIRPSKTCTECFGSTPQLRKVQTFLNELAADKNVINYNGVDYTYNEFWDYTTRTGTPALEDIYGGIYTGTEFKWDNRIPYMDQFYKLDVMQSGSLLSSIVLGFENTNPGNRVYNIRSFFNIRPSCPDPDRYFTVDVELDLYDPYAYNTQPERVVRTITGYIDAAPDVINFAKKFSCCAKLCNKPMVPQIPEEPCGVELQLAADLNAVKNYNAYMEEVRNKFRTEYIAHCLSAPNMERFMMKYNSGEYHYTLYYYDQSGNLAKTVPPQGVVFLTETSAPSLAAVRIARQNYNPAVAPKVPQHTLATYYKYNSLNQLIWQKTPDAGVSQFYYDRVGRISFSQNAKQSEQWSISAKFVYSYTIYDPLGRITEVGEVASPSYYMDHAGSKNPASISYLLGEPRTQVTKTYYDEPVSNPAINALFPQQNMRNRVSHSTVQRTAAAVDQETFYSYDVHGNVKRMARQINSLVEAQMDQGFKTVDYDYDLLSGKVNAVIYQKGQPDQYIHKYLYDMENRLTHVYTGHREEALDAEAQYFYYLHGPLARTEIGKQLVQGSDYVYTINGWLKGVNGISQDVSRDIGRDGYYNASTATLHAGFARDVYGFTLDYYNNDYAPVNSGSGFSAFKGAHASGSTMGGATGALYNGNISAMTTAIGRFMENGAAPLASVYQYDFLNRIRDAKYYNNFSRSSNEWQSGGAVLQDYRNTFSYDGNGNIMTQLRNGNRIQGYDMDDLTYVYKPGTNQLIRVEDSKSNVAYMDDIDGQQRNPANVNYENYEYDTIGNLVKDISEEIEEIEWNVYGKITSIKRIAISTKPDLVFEYTPDGHRSVKMVIPKTGGYVSYTYYMRDAQGNVLATYTRKTEKSINYNELTYAAVNAKIVDFEGSAKFSEFLCNAHPVIPAYTGLFDHVFSSITASQINAENFFKTRSPIGVMMDQNFDPSFYKNMLTSIGDADFIRAIIAKPGSPTDVMDLYERAADIMNQLNALDGSYPTLQYAFFDDMTMREFFFRKVYEFDVNYCEMLASYLGYSGSYDINDIVGYVLALNTSDLLYLYDDNTLPVNNFYRVLRDIDNLQGPLPGWIIPSQFGNNLPVNEVEPRYYERDMLLNFFTRIGGAEPAELMQRLCECAMNVDVDWRRALIESDELRGYYLLALYEYDFDAFMEKMHESGFSDWEDFTDRFYTATAENFYPFSQIHGECSQELFDFIHIMDQKDHRNVLVEILENVPYIKNMLLPFESDFEDCNTNRFDPLQLLPVFLWNTDYNDLWDYLIAGNTGYARQDMAYWFYYNDLQESKCILAQQQPDYYTEYQDMVNIYGGAGNGMENYFNHIRTYLGTTAYNNIVNHFTNISETYVDHVNLNEWMIYGSSRLGSYDTDVRLVTVKYDAERNGAHLEEREYEANPIFEASYSLQRTQLTRGERRYEMNNHLGNVLAVVSDKKIPVMGKYMTGYTFTGTDEGFISSNSGTVTVDGGTRAKAEGSLFLAGMRKAITTVVGSTYSVTFYVDKGNTTSIAGRAHNGTNYFATSPTATVNGTYTLTFVAQTTTTNIAFEKLSNSGTNTYFFIDDVKIYNQSELDYYGAEVIHANDYSPFGAPLPGRSYSYDRRDAVIVDLYKDNMNLAGWKKRFWNGSTPTDQNTTVDLTIDSGKLKFTGELRYCQAYYDFPTVVGRVYRVKFRLSNSTIPLVNISIFSPISRFNPIEYSEIHTFGNDREMIFTATEATTSFYITKGWSSASPTAAQSIYLDYLTIIEVPSQIHYISCSEINEAFARMVNVGHNTSNPTVVTNYLNNTFKRSHTYQEYADILAHCTANPGNYVLAIPGVENKNVKEGYRYGFNGKEKDDEVVGSGNSYDYGFRIYSPRLGRFLSVDPLFKTFAMLTPYQFASNTPIAAIDLDGLEAKIAIYGAGVKRDVNGKIIERHEAQFKREANNDVKQKNATAALAIHTGDILVQTLKDYTASEGSIEYLSIASHASSMGIILDNGQYGKEVVGHKKTANWSGYSSTHIDNIANNADIKFAANALVVFAGCNAGRTKSADDGTPIYSVAKEFTEKSGVASIGAYGYTAPTGPGGSRKADYEYRLFYKDENGVMQQLSLGKVLDQAAIDKAKEIVNNVAQKIEEKNAQPSETPPGN